MGCFGPRLTEEEKSNNIVTELVKLAKDSEKRVTVSRRLDKIKKHLKGNKYER